jgi:D-aminoacyl-tRNA deacylase
MRALLQRVSFAKVVSEGELLGEIGPGLLVLLGITHEDTATDIDWLVKKITQMRIFQDDAGKMNLSVSDVQGEILVVSQFTLFADTQKGNRPSFIRSAPPPVSVPLYEQFVEHLRKAFPHKVATGRFGADMKVSLLNDGPVSIWIDSKQPTY